MIKAEHLGYTYQPGMPFERQALFDINLEIPDGDFAAIIGHTGSGKSTLIQHFNALCMPTDGKLFINGTDITEKDADLKQVRRDVGLVFQYPEHQLFEETVFDDIAYGPKNMGLTGAELEEKVYFAASLTGLSEKHMKRSPFELSGGQKRRAAIAGVLAMDPKILILDEPAAGLDPSGRDSILNMLSSIHEKAPEKTIIFVSHSMEDVAKTAEHVFVMNNGSIDMSGTVAEIFSRGEELSKIGLAVPEITAVTDKLRESGIALPPHIYTVKYAADAIYKMLKGEN